MTKLIVEMVEMPKACRWYEDGTTKLCPIAEFGGGGSACSITKLFEPFDDNRPSWCPIKGELPDEHGDLIDRDAVKKEIMKRMPRGCMSGSSDREGIVCTRRMMLYPISHAKVIVAAERKDDGR